MARGRKTGGRKRGTPNKATSLLAVKAEAAVAGAGGEMPLDHMLRVMRDPATEPHRRDAMAKAAAPYCHPQLQAVAHKHMNADGTPVGPTINLTIARRRSRSRSSCRSGRRTARRCSSGLALRGKLTGSRAALGRGIIPYFSNANAGWPLPPSMRRRHRCRECNWLTGGQ
jgi:hypothetical protein